MCGSAARYSARGELLNNDSRSCPYPFQKSFQWLIVECHASRCRREARTGDVNEDGAAASGYPRAGIVVELDDEVVEPVLAPKAGRRPGPAWRRDGYSAGRPDSRTSPGFSRSGEPATACAAGAFCRPATIAAAAGNGRAACRRHPPACWGGCRFVPRRRGWPANRRSASPARGFPDASARKWSRAGLSAWNRTLLRQGNREGTI